uniref:Uncharacterized protein n=1 Tax=Meloidogyne incognita TaxID=6306 RepID=A0A914L1K6_MELIC
MPAQLYFPVKDMLLVLMLIMLIPISRLPTEIQDLIFWLNSIILKNPLPKILHNGGCLNAKMVHRWIKSANGFVAYLEGEEKESSLNSSGYWEFNQNSEREEEK